MDSNPHHQAIWLNQPCGGGDPIGYTSVILRRNFCHQVKYIVTCDCWGMEENCREYN